MESVLKNSVSNTYYGESAGATMYVLFFIIWSLFNQFKRTPSAEILRELTDSRYTVFNVPRLFSIMKTQWSGLVGNE